MSGAVQQIKDRLAIEEVVSWYVALTPAGNHLRGKSPFTQEKTPSFFVSPDKGFFYCFSSGKGGDMLTFVQEVEGVSFKEALRLLADRAGIEIENYDSVEVKKKAIQKQLLQDVNKWYQVKIRRNQAVIDYLTDRGVNKESIQTFQLGFAPAGNELLSFLDRKKVSTKTAEMVGLVSKGQRGDYYDRFRDRIMFPIWNPQGEVVGFTGRIFLPDQDTSQLAKYMNSPESEWFQKSHLLYGYHLARQSIMKKKQAILVEGQFDVLLSHQAGVNHCVAMSGTALSVKQIGLLKRFADEVVLVLDSDRAGIAASEKTAVLAYQSGMQVRAVSLPTNQDPADIIQQDPEQWRALVSSPISFIKHRISLADFQEMNATEKIKKMQTTLLPLVAVMPSSVQQDLACVEIAEALGVQVSAVRADLLKYGKNTGANAVAQSTQGLGAQDALSALGTREKPEELLVGFFHWIEGDFPDVSSILMEAIAQSEFGDKWEDMVSQYNDNRDALVFRVELLFGSKHERIAELATSLVAAVELGFLQHKFNRTLELLKNQEQQPSGAEAMRQVQQSVQELGQKMQAVRSRLQE